MILGDKIRVLEIVLTFRGFRCSEDRSSLPIADGTKLQLKSMVSKSKMILRKARKAVKNGMLLSIFFVF